MQQVGLPGLEPASDFPDGFLHRGAFLSPAEEADLRARVLPLAYEPFRMRGFTARREVAFFGHGYAYDAREVTEGPPLPPFLVALRGRAAALAGVEPEALATAVVIHYPPGAGIGWHRDAPAFGIVVGISLGGAARLQLRRGGPGGERREVRLEPGSAYVLARAARWAWQHHLPPVRDDRWAITFRTMRGPR